MINYGYKRYKATVNRIIWTQKELQLKPYPRGFHLVTNNIVQAIPEINTVDIGLLHILIKHTSASLTLNENADPSVRRDFEYCFDRLVPEADSNYEHRDEGQDDLPAHIKSSLLGASLNIPITAGRLNLGTWQGIYLCEHRNYGGDRTLLLTLQGKEFSKPSYPTIAV